MALETQHSSLDESIQRLERLTPVVKSLSANAEAWLDSIPMPAFIKNPVGEMAFMNSAYVSAYNIRREDYIGRRDTAAWKPDVAKEFAENDAYVARTKEPLLAEETLEEGRKVTVLKFPVYDGARYLGVGGIVLSDDGETGIPRAAVARYTVHPATGGGD